MPDICAITAPFPGVRKVLEHGQKLGFWDLVVLGDAPVTIPGRPLYILGAWHPFYRELLWGNGGLQRKSDSGISKVVVLWTSSAGEVGFEPVEAEYLKEILDELRISLVWFGHEPLAAAFPKSFYAPYPVWTGDVPSSPLSVEKNRTMTMFFPATLKKNALNQLLAAAIVQREMGYTLETNFPVPPLLHGAGLKWRQHAWLPEDRYRSVLAASSLNFACSWAETLSYQSLEAALLGVPSVGSAAVPWMPEWAIAEPSNPMRIAEVGRDVIGFGGEQREAALQWAAQANAALQEALDRFVSPLL